MLQLYFNVISYYVFYDNILIPLGIPTPLQIDKELYLKEITFIP